ncbi:hypothetical protein ACLK17_23925 [Escherichia coli]
MVYAVIALVGVAIGWLFPSYRHAQQKASELAEREEMVAELSAAKQLTKASTRVQSASYSITKSQPAEVLTPLWRPICVK